MMENEIMVSICCLAYNHEKYIRKALDGMLMQDVDFKYEILIHDDASTDNTANIIREYEKKYPEIIKPIYQKENQYSKKILISSTYQYTRVKGKYVALCEGDDYWIDKNKLQIQVDFMEKNKDYSMCGHSAYYLQNDFILKDRFFRVFQKNTDVSIEEIIEKWVFPTQSIMFRRSCMKDTSIPVCKTKPCGDYPLAIYMALSGKVRYIDKIMSVYRLKSESSLSKKIKANKKFAKNHNLNFYKMYCEIDAFTNYKYKKILDMQKDRVRLNNLLMDGKFIRGKKMYPEAYKVLINKSKLKFFLSYYFPWILFILKKLKLSN